MVRYMSLLEFADQGLTAVADSPKRANEFRQSVESAGGRVISQYWTLGDYDGTVIFEAPDERTATALLLELVKKGDVRTKTTRVFDETEFAEIIS